MVTITKVVERRSIVETLEAAIGTKFSAAVIVPAKDGKGACVVEFLGFHSGKGT